MKAYKVTIMDQINQHDPKEKLMGKYSSEEEAIEAISAWDGEFQGFDGPAHEELFWTQSGFRLYRGSECLRHYGTTDEATDELLEKQKK